MHRNRQNRHDTSSHASSADEGVDSDYGGTTDDRYANISLSSNIIRSSRDLSVTRGWFQRKSQSLSNLFSSRLKRSRRGRRSSVKPEPTSEPSRNPVTFQLSPEDSVENGPVPESTCYSVVRQGRRRPRAGRQLSIVVESPHASQTTSKHTSNQKRLQDLEGIIHQGASPSRGTSNLPMPANDRLRVPNNFFGSDDVTLDRTIDLTASRASSSPCIPQLNLPPSSGSSSESVSTHSSDSRRNSTVDVSAVDMQKCSGANDFRMRNNTGSDLFPGSSRPSLENMYFLQSARSDVSVAGSIIVGDMSTRSLCCPISRATLLNSYESESPDEVALTKTACSYGCKLLQRGMDFVILWLPGEGMVRIQILHVLPFDSHRKCMSIVFRHPATDNVVIYCKGADSVILEKLADSEENKFRRATEEYITAYSHEGLRTMVFAKRVIPEAEYAKWSAAYLQAETDYLATDELKVGLMLQIERDFELLGASGIEDRLQEGVPETLSDLREAGMKLWVLTGDKQETATSIAYAARLFTEEQKLLTVTANNLEEAEAQIRGHIADLLSSNADSDLPSTDTEVEGVNSHFGEHRGIASFPAVSALNNEVPIEITQQLSMVTDGHTLSFLLQPEIRSLFLRLAQLCTSVVCCRVTPNQKAAVVETVKSELKVQTLAIGDGANDVNMIQSADVGVGISGQEGMQAVMASDFAIGRFCFLKRLLLVHGHWCYEKLARMALYMFYKDAFYILSLFWYQFFNGFSGSAHIDQLSQVLFAVTMTSIPPFVLGIFDKPLDQRTLMANPKLYWNGRKCVTYRHWHFWVNNADGIWQSLVIFFVAFSVYMDSNVALWEFGSVCMNCMVFVSLVHIGIESKYWTVFHFTTYIGSYVVLWFFCTMVYNAIGVTHLKPDPPYWVIFVSMQDPKFWLCLFVIAPLALLPRLLMNCLLNTFAPSLEIIAGLLEKKYGAGVRLPLEGFLDDYDAGEFTKLIESAASSPASASAASPSMSSRMFASEQPVDVRHRLSLWFTSAAQLLQRMPHLRRRQIDEKTSDALGEPAALRTISIMSARPSSAPGQCDARVLIVDSPLRQRNAVTREHVSAPKRHHRSNTHGGTGDAVSFSFPRHSSPAKHDSHHNSAFNQIMCSSLYMTKASGEFGHLDQNKQPS